MGWLMAAHRARILSSFPEMGEHPAFKSMTFTLEQITKTRWIGPEQGKFYKLEPKNSPYEKYIDAIAGPENCPKMRALRLVMDKVWGKDQKVAIMTMSPALALIVYWASLLW